MKTKFSLSATRPVRKLALAGLIVGLAGGSPAFSQSVNEDEWYDPTDWFDGNNIEVDDTYDYSVYDYDYDYGLDDTYDYGDDWSVYDTWGDELWDSDYYDSDYWDDYDWYDTYDAIDDDTVVRTYTYTIFTSPADHQSQSGETSSSSASSNQQKSKSQKQSVARLDGTIEGLREMKLKQSSGATGTYTIANIKLENGKNAIVNLGRSSRLENLKLKKGDSIQAVGRRGTIAGKTVFVAQKLKSGEKTIDANPVIRLSDQQIAQKQNEKTVSGTVADVSQSTSRAQNDHTLLNLRLENGQSATVDLGPAASLEKIDLQEGEKVTVRGYTKKSEGRDVLVPTLMKVEGQKISSVSE